MAYTKSEITRTGYGRFNYWKVDNRVTNGTNGFEIHWSDNGECITDHVYTKEDANLIASAPLLLETLKLLDLMGGLGLDNHSLIRSAILLAENGEI